MPRSLRYQYPYAVYHVMNRGTDRRAIVLDPDDYVLFLATLSKTVCCFNTDVLAFCIMQNHFHLLIRTPEPNLSETMRHFLHSYTQRFNKKYDRDGPLFRGRFKSLYVQNESYFLEVIRYIHLNPVKAGIVRYPEDYIWSSHPEYLTFRPNFPWLRTEEILSKFHIDSNLARQKFDDFVKAGNSTGVELFYSRERLGGIINDEVISRTIESRIVRG